MRFLPRSHPSGPLILAALLAASAAQALNVRVLVASAPQVVVRVPVRPAGTGLTGGPLGAAAPLPLAGWTVGLTPDGARLTLNGQDAGNVALYLPPSVGSVVEIGGKTYRGGVQLRVQAGRVQAINVVDVEDYVRSVVPAEMPTSWPVAALSAQAVIARTYVAARITPNSPYDTCATESCQVYPGVGAETPSSDAAVLATRGQVVAYGTQPASTYFSADSGGYTASSAEVWGKALPYLPAQTDPFSAGSPRAHWRLEVGAAKLAEVAARYHVQVGAIQSVAVTRLSPSGRPLEITLTGSTGTGRIDGANAGGFVRSLGAAGTRVTLDGTALATGGPLVVEGSGAGHGVGLSQYGALGLARQGYSHLYVLGFYYPGTSLSVLAGRAAGGALLAGDRDLPRPSAAVLAVNSLQDGVR
ncbi:SpoIID/LytB domain-containing protein [Deinococcus sp. KSM4-11]|uniref:SpoIID/LytB domain-containing protein n=1 Tax=Deinococcus sp. KSM4-11 TaxID=2568654 RepID=UPI0010A4B5DA|nr:SpoIID/LytB domain-containing protein [Deinococcus sp. KSM4-11]THF86203.1 SpoIID/LytB domain-containing protein [Deinococcus sp. KSM4-11]